MKIKESEQQHLSEKVHLNFAGLEQKECICTGKYNRIQEEIKQFEEELEELKLNKGNAVEEIQAKEEEISDLQRTIEESKDLFEEIQKEIEEKTKQREELSNKNKSFWKKEKHCQNTCQILTKNVSV